MFSFSDHANFQKQVYYLTLSPTVHQSSTRYSQQHLVLSTKTIGHYNRFAVIWHFDYNLYI